MNDMILFMVVFLVFMMLVALMSIGVMVGRKPISGSCGGLRFVGMKDACDLCGGNKKNCKKNKG